MTDHRPDWDMARLAPLSRRTVERLWDHHAHQRLTGHRMQELLAELVDLLHDPSMTDSDHPAVAERCVTEHIEAYRDEPSVAELSRQFRETTGLPPLAPAGAPLVPEGCPGLGVADTARLARRDVDWRTVDEAKVAHLRVHHDEPW